MIHSQFNLNISVKDVYNDKATDRCYFKNNLISWRA
jgi:hypothetical protein